MQCYNCQKCGHIAKICTVDSKCGHCAGEYNTRNCTGKKDVRCSNCGKGHKIWDQSCSVRVATKHRAVQNSTQDPGMFVIDETSRKHQDGEWQIAGSRKRRAILTEPLIGMDGNIAGLRRLVIPCKIPFAAPTVAGLFANLNEKPQFINPPSPPACDTWKSSRWHRKRDGKMKGTSTPINHTVRRQ